MKKINIIVCCLILVVIHASCGSGGGVRTGNLTIEQQQLLLDTVQASLGSSSSNMPAGVSDSTSGEASASSGAPVVDVPFTFSQQPQRQVVDETLDFVDSYTCDRGGIYADLSNTEGRIAAQDCITYEGSSFNGLTDLVMNGDISYQVSNNQIFLSYNQVSVRRNTRTCSLSGNVILTATSRTPSTLPIDFSLINNCGTTRIVESGHISVSLRSYPLANGVMTVSVGNSGPHDCVFSNFYVDTGTCSNIASACRLSPVLCTGSQVTSDMISPSNAGNGGGSASSGGSGMYSIPATSCAGVHCAPVQDPETEEDRRFSF